MSLRGRRNLSWAERMSEYRTRIVVDEGDCWLWQGKVRSDGYGVVCVKRLDRLVHQVFYEQLVGRRTEGHHLHHLCLNKNCCNPSHLRQLSISGHAIEHMESILSAQAASASARRRLTHCKWGHEFTRANTYIARGGGRYCRECNRLRTARRAAA